MSKNADLNGKINSLEHNLKIREANLADLRAELEALKKAYGNALDQSDHLDLELKRLEESIKKMEYQNEILLKELQDWHRKDEEVKAMLDRKNRVDLLKNQSGNTLGESINIIDKIRSSPIRKKTNFSPNKY